MLQESTPRPARTLFVPLSLEELHDERLSDSSVRLLMHVRHRADTDMTDGAVTEAAVRGFAAERGWSRSKLVRARQELLDLGYLDTRSGSLIDANFLKWCKSRARRLSEREHWNDAKKRRPLEGESA